MARKPKEYAPHPIAQVFPSMVGDEFERFEQDIREHGLREPIVLFEGKILDGRNRYLACQLSGIPLKFKTWKGPGSPVDYVISKNLSRRHLDESQRAMVAAKLATLREGRPKTNTTQICAPSQAEAAKAMNVSPRSVQSAKKVQKSGDKKLIKAVEAGDVSVSAAAKRTNGKAAKPPKPPKPDEPPTDELGAKLKPSVAKSFDRIPDLKELQKRIALLKKDVRAICETPIGAFLAVQQADADLQNVWTAIKFAMPYAQCPKCNGAKCASCRKTGWVPKQVLGLMPK